MGEGEGEGVGVLTVLSGRRYEARLWRTQGVRDASDHGPSILRERMRYVSDVEVHGHADVDVQNGDVPTRLPRQVERTEYQMLREPRPREALRLRLVASDVNVSMCNRVRKGPWSKCVGV